MNLLESRVQPSSRALSPLHVLAPLVNPSSLPYTTIVAATGPCYKIEQAVDNSSDCLMISIE